MATKEELEDFERAYNWLFSFVTDPEGKRYRIKKTIAQRRAEMEGSIPQMADFLAFAGHPERKIPSIHVTGTSGKGSVSMMTDAILQGMGLRTGLHISPYLQLPTEKLMTNGVPLSPKGFVELVRSFRKVHEAWATADGPYTKLRYTQAWTALTFMWLAQQNLDIAVVESGMGGRFDYTNLMPSEIAIITNVAFDHVMSLGPELTDIAWHKAGIMKQNKPAITGVTEPELLPILEKEAAEKNSKLYVLDRDFSFEVHDVNTITVNAPYKTYEYVKVGPVGRYQLGNAALAIVALDVLVAEGKLEGPVKTAALANFSCPGRMEQVSQNPTILLDGAHNPHKMEALVSSVSEAFPNKKIISIIGFIGNKEVNDIVDVLLPAVDEVIVTVPNVPGKAPADPEKILEKIKETSDIPVSLSPNINAAIDCAKILATPDDLILITGSLYLVGEARELWYPMKA